MRPLLALLLLLAAASSPGAPSGSFQLPPGYYLYAPVHLLAGQRVGLSFSSNATVDVYLMSGGQFLAFQSTGEVQGYEYHVRGESASAEVGPLTAGTYYLVIYNDASGAAAEGEYSVWTTPVDIYSIHSSLPAPIGEVDYGVLNNTELGELAPYELAFKEAVGYAEIYSIYAYSPSPPAGASHYGASLQLNVVMQVNTSAGPRWYWLQDVADFNTRDMELWFDDNVWNFSGQSSLLTNSSVEGKGYVISYGQDYLYAYGTQPQPYGLPLGLRLLVACGLRGPLAEADFGYSIGGGPVIWYDNVTIYQPGAESAELVVDGYNYTPSGTFYDAELVFGGECCGEVAYFEGMNATLNLKYVLPNGTAVVPPAVYGFGSDTAEEAEDLTSSLSGGRVLVTVGSGYFGPLGYSAEELSNVTFVEEGLPPGATWGVTFDGETKFSNGSSITFSGVLPGSYEYNATAILPWGPGTRFKALNPSGQLLAPQQPGATVRYEEQFYLNVSAYPPWAGSVSPGPGWYDAGSEVELRAEAVGGYAFHSWEGSGAGSYSGPDDPAEVVLRGPTNEVAAFYVGLTADALGLGPSASGYVVYLNGEGYSYAQLPATIYVPYGSEVNYSFAQVVWGPPGVRYVWSGPPWNSSGAVALTGPSSVVGSYEEQFYLNVSAYPPWAGSVSPGPGWYDAGSEVELRASPASALYAFEGWSGDVRGSSPTAAIVVDSPTAAVARFGYNYWVLAAAALPAIAAALLLARRLRRQ